MAVQELLKVLGAEAIALLQSWIYRWAVSLMSVLSYADPSFAFTHYLPLVVPFSLSQGSALLWTLVTCEWLCTMIQWLLPDDRPFWWIYESPHYLYKELPSIRQYPPTCVGSPGLPDVYCAYNAALIVVLASALTSHSEGLLQHYVSKKICIWVNRIVWTAGVLWICLITTAQIFFGAHFPHQSIIGVFIGLGCGIISTSTNLFTSPTKKKVAILMSTILGSVFGLVSILWLLGIDRNVYAQKAIRWCIKKDYIHLDLTPFYPLARLSGLCLGFWLALRSSSYSTLSSIRFSWKMKVSVAVLTLAVGQSSAFVHNLLPQTTFFYYPSEILMNAIHALLIIFLIPKFVANVSGEKPKTKPKRR